MGLEIRLKKAKDEDGDLCNVVARSNEVTMLVRCLRPVVGRYVVVRYFKTLESIGFFTLNRVQQCRYIIR